MSYYYDDGEEAFEEIDELFSIIPDIDRGIDDSEFRQYEDLDDEEFDIDFWSPLHFPASIPKQSGNADEKEE